MWIAHYKTKLKFNNHLLFLPTSLRHYICKLRTCNTKLPNEQGQYTHVPRERRYCILCTIHFIRDKYPLLFECNHFIELRKQYLSNYMYYIKTPSVFKCVHL